jgi:hypothetical protein
VRGHVGVEDEAERPRLAVHEGEAERRIGSVDVCDQAGGETLA